MDIDSPTTSESFTCITCRVAFKDAEMQRLHYKTDWHRYNLKRKVAELPPVTTDEFQRRVLNQRNVDQKAAEPKNVYCEICRKSFSNPNAFSNHLNSKKHKENERTFVPKTPNSEAATVDSDEEVEELDSDEWEDDIDNPIDNNNCLFCLHHSRNFITNLEHMTIAHSFFIPDIEYCIDVDGLLRYLGEKISDGFMCLWCNEKGKTFYSADAARKHMLDKGHCKMLHEGISLAEYADFYDYSTSYPDANSEDVNKDEEVKIAQLDDSDYQLVLPSGATIGHRSLMKYYRQKINPNAVVPVKSDKKLHKVLATYRALGWTATQQEAAAKTAKDVHYMKRLQAKYNMQLGVKANKFQKHFRAQVNF